jgi:hypothetical protein
MKRDQVLGVLQPRQKPAVKTLVDAVEASLLGAHKLEFYSRLQDAHQYRAAWWEGQHASGRKVADPEEQRPDEIFPWPGASDVRIRLIDEIIKERVDLRMVSMKRAELRLLPSDLMLADDEEGMRRAAGWRLLMEYYLKETAKQSNRELRRWADIAEEFGHSIMHVTWQVRTQLTARELAGLQVLQAMTEQALLEAEAEAQLDGLEELTEEQAMAVASATEARVEALLSDEALVPALMEQLQQLDPQMPEVEARRLARSLQDPNVRLEEPVQYFAPAVLSSLPRLRALTPFVDVFYPAETESMEDAEWVAVQEWLSAPELREKQDSEGWDPRFVKEVLEKPGRAVDMASLTGVGGFPWVMSGAGVGLDVLMTDGTEDRRELFQVLHVYYRATSLGNTPAVYHTVVHGQVPDRAGLHEVCEEAHGELPFVELMCEPEAPLLLASRGVPEVSFTYQQEVKTQRDMRADWSSLQIRPPAEVPISHGSRLPDIRPGRMIPRRTTGGMGGITFLQVPGNIGPSLEIETAAKRSLDEFWGRGPEVDPDVKLARRQSMVDDFLGQVQEVRKKVFQLAQQYAPERIRVGAIGGLEQRLEVSREEIQGQVSMDLQFDAADLDFERVGKKIEILQTLIRPMDTEGNMPVYELLRAATTMLLPSWSRTLLRNPMEAQGDEAEDEKRAMSELLAGIEAPYVPGKNHALRLQLMQEAMQRPGADGGPSRVQQVLQESADVQALWQNRMEFHEFQVQQTQVNPSIGRLGVEPVQ